MNSVNMKNKFNIICSYRNKDEDHINKPDNAFMCNQQAQLKVW